MSVHTATRLLVNNKLELTLYKDNIMHDRYHSLSERRIDHIYEQWKTKYSGLALLPGSALFNGNPKQYLGRPRGDVLTSPGGNPFTFIAWTRFNVAFTSFQAIAGKYDGGGVNNEWTMIYNNSTQKMTFFGSNTGTGGGVASDAAGIPVIGTWYMFAGGWDGTNLWVARNNTARNTTAYAGPLFRGSMPFQVGHDNTYGINSPKANISKLSYWNRNLSDAEVATLFNNGVSFTDANIPFRNGLISWYNLNEGAGVIRKDSIGGFDLIDYGYREDPSYAVGLGSSPP